MPDVVELTKALIAAPSITPARGTVFDVLEAALTPLGFEVERFVAGEAPDGPVENLLAVRSAGPGPHFAFAGHLDVVPPGEGWASGAFEPEIRGDLLYGRGAVDMKGAIAAFVAALGTAPASGTVSLIITGDEEGPATYGTVAIIERMAARGLTPNMCLVGEPTSARRLGDTIKIGRRGSTVIDIEVPGRQGHVAYPHLADNPVPRLVRALAEIDAIVLDEGTDWFQPSNIEVIDLEVGNPATNVIPGRAKARISIRFNDQHRGHDLIARVQDIVHAHAPAGIVRGRVYGEAFLTEPGALSTLVSEAIHAQTGVTAELSTSGGTSDARFLSRICPVVEFGLLNATMHKLDEAVALDDLHVLTRIYTGVLGRVFAG
ncbi:MULTISPECIES: succinyl-diaminopimelate desuccinylase [unclassified Sphingomonas]|uniref:succinyl-diaminopimelate desuccinylase n=1 Tax=unclassified Sphingomonas TaxID=196159 RepID=UPI002150D24F|nr:MULTISPECIES: succinyl-diaminopimelate desuccinylase [unclassified Sphingomonas]MCR5869591.1 succinyl-diaminopimelate desuccinylase [Sphingomonas sp. J344]UUX98691.1 succinyl-diaminopimelate desuccinylase [Sphingomonas sp. J315]